MQPRILVVDDEKNMRWSLSQALEGWGYEVLTASDGLEAVEIANLGQPHLVLLDDKMPRRSGLDTLPILKKRLPETPVIMITAHGSIETAVAAMKAGADDYITKPFHLDAIRLTIERSLKVSALAEENRRLKHELGWDLVGESPAMQRVRRLLEQVAGSDATVLLLGESGTGKELAARAVHELSPRRNGPFVIVNAAAIPEELLESELFGHEKGAFTGAEQARTGRLASADGGTAFLDEIGELSPRLQAKLLRFLQEKTVEPLGSNRTLPVDVRVVAATNRDLRAEVEAGRFREDLFYRLHVFPVVMPPLRERKEDIPALAEYFLRRFDRAGQFAGFSDETLARLQAYSWPGNVRELQNAVERATITCQGPAICPECLPPEIGAESTAQTSQERGFPWLLPPDGVALAEVERELVRQALTQTGGNRTQAAELLGISRYALIYRMQKYNLAGEVE